MKKPPFHTLRSIYQNLKQSIISPHGVFSYSANGEDLIVASLFKGKWEGFYVDIGAFQPIWISNTYLFYLRGWNGINIEPNPNSAGLFKRYRKRDVNLCCGISNHKGSLPYIEMSEPAMNTCRLDVAESYVKEHDVQILTTHKTIPVYPLREILAAHVPDGTQIDFFSIDVEGSEMEVLKSNNWDRWHPRVIIVEDNNHDGISRQFLRNRGYRDYCQLDVSYIMVSHEA